MTDFPNQTPNVTDFPNQTLNVTDLTSDWTHVALKFERSKCDGFSESDPKCDGFSESDPKCDGFSESDPKCDGFSDLTLKCDGFSDSECQISICLPKIPGAENPPKTGFVESQFFEKKRGLNNWVVSDLWGRCR